MKRGTESKFVYVRLATKKSAPAKKVILPSSIPALKKSVAKIFNLNEPVGGFQNQQDEYIRDIRDISGGSLIYVVLKSKTDTESIKSSAASSMKNSTSRTADKLETGSQSSLKLTVNNNKPKQTLTLNVNNSSNQNTKSQTPTMKITSTENVQRTTPKSAKTNKQLQLTKNAQKTPQNQKSNLIQASTDNKSEDYDEDDSKEYSDSYKDEEADEATTDGECLFKLAIPNFQEFADSINEGFYQISEETRDFLCQALKLEYVQKSRYFHGILSTAKEFGMFNYDEKWIHLDKMQKKARSLIKAKRIPSGNGFTYVMKTAILGPSKSGKSTFLYVYLRELLIDLVATDTWRSTFVFPYDISIFVDDMIDLKEMYKNYIHYLFKQFHVQCPSLVSIFPGIEKCFESVTENQGHVLLPRRLTQDIELKTLAATIDEIVQLLAKIWADPEQYEVWLGNIALLPKRLATAFGFKQVINVFDHFDISNTNIDPGRPFIASEYTIFPSELLKYALLQGPFILGAKNSIRFGDTLNSINQDISLDLRSYVDVFYLWNLIDKSMYSNKEISIEFAQSKTQLRVTSYACGGIPNYLIKWNLMNKTFDELEELEEGSPEYEDFYCELVTLVEGIVHQLYISEDKATSAKTATVADVHRHTIE